jgi:hypothetical protein
MIFKPDGKENLEMGAYLRTDKQNFKKDLDLYLPYSRLEENKTPGTLFWRRTADAQ